MSITQKTAPFFLRRPVFYTYDAIGNRLRSRTDTATDSGGTLTEYFSAASPSIVAGANILNQYARIKNGSNTVSPNYDDDGNATAYPLPAHVTANSSLSWDAENRLKQVTVNSVATTYLYDALSRRIAKVPASGSPTLYLYDGFNCIAEYTGSTPTLSKTRTWGLDLSGTLQGAGGVGGLLVTGGYYPTYDGNGNISEYLTNDSYIAAHYEYDPFGNTVVSQGSQAADFEYRFSTKPLDFETGLYYYLYRYYDPLTGRWPSRDPIEESGGLNLYGFVGNNGVGKWDHLGYEANWQNTGGWSLGQTWKPLGFLDALVGFKTTSEGYFACSCHQHGCLGGASAGYRWNHAWTDYKYRYFTYEHMLQDNAEHHKAVSDALTNASYTASDSIAGVPAIPQVEGNPFPGTLEDQRDAQVKQFEKQIKAREVWNVDRNKLWDEMKKKCQESCQISTDYWHLREYPYKSVTEVGGEIVDTKLFVGGGGGIRYLHNGDFDPQTTKIKWDILMEQRKRALGD